MAGMVVYRLIIMKRFSTIAELEAYVSQARKENKTIGLVPTMGALHDGHLSLVKKACAENDVVVVSVFVNPTQFNNPTDLATYPRCEHRDAELLADAGASAMFAPSVEEIYPADSKEKTHIFNLGSVAEVMEGKYRPGHFQGVAQIVSKLLRLVGPDRAYFGEKDFQQIAVIKQMVKNEKIDVQIVMCPIMRAEDGLALSSRNQLLTRQQRAVAPGIFAALSDAVSYSALHSVAQTHDHVVEAINSLPECEVEYFEIVDADTLQPVDSWDDAGRIQGCITVYCGKVRLIDNIAFRK